MHSNRMRTACSSSRPKVGWGSPPGTPPTRHRPGTRHPPDQAPPGPGTPRTRHPPDQATPPGPGILPGPGTHNPNPSVNRMTNRCKNITLPQTSLAGGNQQLRFININCKFNIRQIPSKKFTKFKKFQGCRLFWMVMQPS